MQYFRSTSSASSKPLMFAWLVWASIGHVADGVKETRKRELRGAQQDQQDQRETMPKEHHFSKNPPKVPQMANDIDASGTKKKRLIVSYKNPKGKEDAMKVAEQVYQDNEKDSFVVLDMTPDNEELLLQNENILEYDEDTIWTELGYLERHHEGRMLRESIPYGIPMIQADEVEVGPHPVKVCLVDTGFAQGHPDLDSSRASGKDRTSKVNGDRLRWNIDTRGHGSHCAGTVAAKIGNGKGIRGVGDIELYITRGLNEQGAAFESDIIEAVEQCEDAGAKIISMSLGGGGISRRMSAMWSRLSEEGYIIIGAAGNEGRRKPMYPASHPDVISVAAVNAQKRYWPYSNYGKWIELSAPGHSVLSTVSHGWNRYGYAYYSGTSMATPHVAGVAAILWSHFPDCTNHQIRYAMAYSALDVGMRGCDADYGYGIVQAKDAYDFLSTHSCVGANWGKSPSTGECSTIDRKPGLAKAAEPAADVFNNNDDNDTTTGGGKPWGNNNDDNDTTTGGGKPWGNNNDSGFSND